MARSPIYQSPDASRRNGVRLHMLVAVVMVVILALIGAQIGAGVAAMFQSSEPSTAAGTTASRLTTGSDSPSDAPSNVAVAEGSPAAEYDLSLVASSFQSFWDMNHGAALFGSPVTEIFTGRDGHPIEYFERARFEYHPDNPSPNKVMLARLGSLDAARRGLLDSDPFRARAGNPDNGLTCQFFPQTGHSVCGKYLNFWSYYGSASEMEGNAFQRSIELFGYPISEPFVDEESGREVQYFERVRMEYYPDNSEHEQVLLAPLGTTLLDASGSARGGG